MYITVTYTNWGGLPIPPRHAEPLRTPREREVIQRHFNLQLGLDTLPQFGFERKRITRDVLQRAY